MRQKEEKEEEEEEEESLEKEEARQKCQTGGGKRGSSPCALPNLAGDFDLLTLSSTLPRPCPRPPLSRAPHRALSLSHYEGHLDGKGASSHHSRRGPRWLEGGTRRESCFCSWLLPPGRKLFTR